MSVQERIAECYRLAKETPIRERPREDASPFGTYRQQPRVCTVCGNGPIVADGRYWCVAHHPEHGGARDERVG